MTRLKQALILLLGLLACSIMIVLGLWQKQVYENQGAEAAAQREAQPPLVLTQVAPPSQPVREGFGRSVSFSGTYLADQQLLVPTDGAYRVLTPLQLPDGGIVAVVRGTVPTAAAAPAPPTGVQHQVGVLAASEGVPEQPVTLPPNQVQAVQLSVLAQRWTQPMVSGYVTLKADEARVQGLAPATAQLPHNSGRFRNGAYAVQWWVFAVFAIGMAVKMARDLGRRDLLADESAAQADLGDGAAEAADPAVIPDAGSPAGREHQAVPGTSARDLDRPLPR